MNCQKGYASTTDTLNIDFLGYQQVLKLNQKEFIIEEKASNYLLTFEAWQNKRQDKLLDPEHTLLERKNTLDLCDWLFYQLIRRTANTIVPKDQDYLGYTLAKWQLLKESGYDPLMLIQSERIYLYIRCEDSIYNQPVRMFNGNQYVCLNAHDYGGQIALQEESLLVGVENGVYSKTFTFRIDKLPEMPETVYHEKKISFNIGNIKEDISLRLNPLIGTYYTNYPVTEYTNQFNIPLSTGVRNSLIRSLSEKIKHMNQKNGIEYLMNFTRNAFEYAPDTEIFGKEKRLSPEETLLSKGSDCEDRAALLYYLIRELYNVPILVLSYPDHVSLAVKLEKPIGKSILYNGERYSYCEPTPQSMDLRLGEQDEKRISSVADVIFAYRPQDYVRTSKTLTASIQK